MSHTYHVNFDIKTPKEASNAVSHWAFTLKHRPL